MLCADAGAFSAAWCWTEVEIANVAALISARVTASTFTLLTLETGESASVRPAVGGVPADPAADPAVVGRDGPAEDGAGQQDERDDVQPGEVGEGHPDRPVPFGAALQRV